MKTPSNIEILRLASIIRRNFNNEISQKEAYQRAKERLKLQDNPPHLFNCEQPVTPQEAVLPEIMELKHRVAKLEEEIQVLRRQNEENFIQKVDDFIQNNLTVRVYPKFMCTPNTCGWPYEAFLITKVDYKIEDRKWKEKRWEENLGLTCKSRLV